MEAGAGEVELVPETSCGEVVRHAGRAVAGAGERHAYQAVSLLLPLALSASPSAGAAIPAAPAAAEWHQSQRVACQGEEMALWGH